MGALGLLLGLAPLEIEEVGEVVIVALNVVDAVMVIDPLGVGVRVGLAVLVRDGDVELDRVAAPLCVLLTDDDGVSLVVLDALKQWDIDDVGVGVKLEVTLIDSDGRAELDVD